MTLIALGFYQLVGLLSSVNLPQGNVLGYASNINIQQIIEGTNKERAAQGLVTLTYNTLLAEAAAGKARDMFTDQYWAHTSPSGKEPWDFIKSVNYNYKVAGENLARDFDSTPPMMAAWMNSPTHKANIMNPRYRDIGLAVVDGNLNGVETTLVVQMFGTLATDTESPKTPSVEVAGVTLENNVPKKVTPEKVIPEKATPEKTTLAQQIVNVNNTTSPEENVKQEEVLATSVVPQGNLSQGILLSPLHLLKAFFLSIIFLLIAVLLYDGFVAGHRKSIRLVGKNLAHIILFIFVAYLVVFFKGGVV